MPSNLQEVLLNTIRYFDLFDQPVTATQLWQLQVGAAAPQTLAAVRSAALAAVATGQLETSSGYYYLPGRHEIVATWLHRHSLAQQKWKLTGKIARFLQYVPFVKMIAMSGSLAAGNTRPTSDLDLLVIVEAKRIWLARASLLALTALMGRRRRHWDRQAPDKVCLNHYLTDEALTIAPEIQNLYTAIVYRSLITLAGEEWHQKFMTANEHWIGQYVNTPTTPVVPSRHVLPRSRILSAWQRAIEAVGREPLFDWLELVAERLQRWVITRHSKPGRAGRVVITSQELAFHPDSKVPALLARYYSFK